MPSASKPEFIRCPHCPKRYGSEQTLAAHVADHRAQYFQAMVAPEHREVLHPQRHAERLRQVIKRHRGR